MKFKLEQIGTIKTPYQKKAPYQPIDNEKGYFAIILDPQYTDGLYKIDSFRYIYVLYYIHQINETCKMIIKPSWTEDTKTGVFASRSPIRPNHIGLSVVKVKYVHKNKIITSGLDVFDGTPVLDIKPYIKDLDSKNDANHGGPLHFQ